MKTTRTARTPRFFHDGAIDTDSELELSKKASHHLITVVRTKTNERIELFNGDGYNYKTVVTDTGQRTPGKRARLQILERTESATESPITITLVQAISRGDRMDITIRQAVELGVSRIQPTFSRHSAKALDEKRTAKKMEHWQNIIISACEQSGRTRIPILKAPVALPVYLGQSDHVQHSDQAATTESGVGLILAPNSERGLAEQIRLQTRPMQSCTVFIGPESGFDENEINMAVYSGVHAVNFGTRILRTETAGPTAIAVVQSLSGDLR